MSIFWDYVDFDAHEDVHFFHDRASGLQAIIAVHSTHLGPAAGGARYWYYPDKEAAIVDALRLSRGMSYKNAMAGLPVGGGKAVILAPEDTRKAMRRGDGLSQSEARLVAFGRAVESLHGRYITAEDVGMSERDMVVVARETKYVGGLPCEGDAVGGEPGPVTSRGVFYGIQAAIQHRLRTDSAKDVRVAIQGVGSVGGGVARLLAAEGARLVLADVDTARAQALADELGADCVDSADITAQDVDVFSPNALGAVFTESSIEKLRAVIVAGGANNQCATAADAEHLHARGVTYAPDYVINAGGIINIISEYLGNSTRADVEKRLQAIAGRLTDIWQTSEKSGLSAAEVADRMARKLIGRAAA